MIFSATITVPVWVASTVCCGCIIFGIFVGIFLIVYDN